MKSCWNLLSILVLSSFLSSTLADYTCSPSITINPPVNISNAWFYPNTWNDSLPAPTYAAGQNCSWIINIPKGMYAWVSVNASTNTQSSLTLVDSVSYSTRIEDAGLEPFFLLDPSFTVTLQAVQMGTFGIRVQWYNVRPVIATSWSVRANSSPLALYAGDFDNSTVIRADTQVSLLATHPRIFGTNYFLRATQVYDGPSINSTHLGNLYQVLSSGKNLVSSGTYLTLYSLQYGLTVGNAVVLQDYTNVNQFKSYQAVYCTIPDACPVSLDATNGTAAAIHFNELFFVKQLSMATNNTMSVYTNYFSNSNKLADYTYSNYLTSIPQKFPGTFTTFVLDNDHASFQLASTALNADWSSAVDGRRGFFSSANYGIINSNQDFDDQVTAVKYSNISYTVDRPALFGQSTLNVTITYKQNIVLNNVYTVSNYPGPPVYALGDSITVSYKLNGGVSSGPFVSFGFDSYSSASTHGIFVTIVLAVWMIISL
ncbi:CUB-like domain-containing protein [Caenorhabditis elegans]|uniref:CUB-like domain-containing protein n=1 Tax=Caenorhabditis elegans TaxID=6239 RepID=Q9XUA8_CAEEL|nr:CUB-like domain-containing protein [Caenorhabditis elegans]CAB05320.2 CUB-like domain-containing protein [Caenorhabditis elegans]|eukprot:NP_502453.1 Uncharacterized protein CELE_ZK896.5 [Caenorhabditis elegans]